MDPATTTPTGPAPTSTDASPAAGPGLHTPEPPARDPASPDPSSSDPLVSLAELRAAAERLRGIAVRTPLLPFGPPLEGDPHGRPRAWLKPEGLQHIGAFKIRGAYNTLAQLTAEERARGVVTHSSGNHAQGVSRAARLLGIRAVVVMPSDAPLVKVEGVRADGAEIDFVGPSNEERIARADELAERDGLVLVPSYDDRRIVAGQGTIGLEIVEQLAELGLDGLAAAGGQAAEAGLHGLAAAGGQAAEAGLHGLATAGGQLAELGPDGAAASGGQQAEAAGRQAPPTILVPIGGGGLSSGVAAAIKALRPDARVLGVEPELAADARDSLREGRLVRWDPELATRTIADGMRTSSLGRITFAHLHALLDGVVTVGEEEICRAMARAARLARLVLEPSGATSLAAWLFHAGELPADGPVVIVLSGGNVDQERYATLVAQGIAAGG